MIKKVPVPLCGVMLGTAALGNLLQGLFNNVLAPEAGIGDPIRNICGVFAAFLLVLILLKLIMFPGMVKEDMQNPIMAGVFKPHLPEDPHGSVQSSVLCRRFSWSRFQGGTHPSSSFCFFFSRKFLTPV